MYRYMLSLILFLSVSGIALGQKKVTYMRDTIFADGTPYAVMKKTGTVFPNYSLRSLDNKEILTARYDKIEGVGKRYIITFSVSGKKAAMRYDIAFGKVLAEEIVQSNLIVTNNLNPEGEKRILTAFPIPENK